MHTPNNVNCLEMVLYSIEIHFLIRELVNDKAFYFDKWFFLFYEIFKKKFNNRLVSNILGGISYLAFDFFIIKIHRKYCQDYNTSDTKM